MRCRPESSSHNAIQPPPKSARQSVQQKPRARVLGGEPMLCGGLRSPDDVTDGVDRSPAGLPFHLRTPGRRSGHCHAGQAAGGDRPGPEPAVGVRHGWPLELSKDNTSHGGYFTVPLQAPVSCPRFSMYCLNRSRSPCTRCVTTPTASPTFSTKPCGSYSICSMTFDFESDRR